MARENKLPILELIDTGYHTKITEEIGDKYKCFNFSTKEEITISKELLQFVKPEIIKEHEESIFNTK